MLKVLIVDDEPWSREVVRSLGNWGKYGMEVAGEAEDGTEGLRLARTLGPDIVITDMRMPGLEGDELLRAFGGLFPAPKIIVMSGYDDFAYLKQAIQSKAVNYLLKPIDPAELDKSLRQCLRELEAVALESKPLFREKALAARYAACRQQIRECLAERDPKGLSAAVERMEDLFSTEDAAHAAPEAFKKVGYDLLPLLYEYEAGGSGLPSEKCSGELEQALESGWSSASDAFRTFGTLLFKAVNRCGGAGNAGRIDFADVRRYIDYHFAEPISLESLARRFFVSKEYLSRAFKTFAGENMTDYITRKRMERAHALILQKQYEIRQISRIVGYEDNAYFYRVFKKYYGCTPGEVRG